jgi:RHS repeat-associated protein
VEKVWNNSQWVQTAEVRYVYDHMLAVQERNQNNVPQVTYTRGVDLSGGLQRAGGIGGLLARTDQNHQPSTHAYYHTDGSGNVTALVDSAQQVAARYQYDPYGNLLGLSGSMAEANAYRFSSKEFHATSGLYYYGYRFYAPSLQRWINRDPIGEWGGVNLYCFVANDPLDLFDTLGFKIKCKGKYKDFYAGVLACWRNKLPKDAKLCQILDALDRNEDTYVICEQTAEDLQLNRAPFTSSANWWFRVDPPTITRIDPRPYQIGRRNWRFTEALAHELLHAYDWLTDNPRRFEPGGHDESFWEDEKQIIQELRLHQLDW